MTIVRPAVRLAVSLAVLSAACKTQPPEAASSADRDGARTVISVAPTIAHHDWAAIARLPSGRVLVASDGISEVYDPATDTWTATAVSPPLLAGDAIAFPDGRMVLTCNAGQERDVMLDIRLYDPISGTWSVAAQFPEREYCHAARLQDGSVLMVGGRFLSSSSYDVPSLIFDPTTSSVISIAALPRPRTAPVAVTLNDGRVLAIGGWDGQGISRAVDIYTPGTGTGTGTFTLGPDLLRERVVTKAVLLNDGRVLVIGDGWSAPSFAEVFDPGTRRWTATGPMVVPREAPAAVVLEDGRVVLLGGSDANNMETAAVEVFDPSTNTFSPLPTLPQALRGLSAVLLADGRILVVGGYHFPPIDTPHRTTTLIYDVDGTCVPATCDAAGASCGTISDGCGGTLACGTCGADQACTANRCTSLPRTCASWPGTCGDVSDGAGGTLHCGACASGLSCIVNTCLPPSVTATNAASGPPGCAQRTMSCESGMLLVGRGPYGPGGGPEIAQGTFAGCNGGGTWSGGGMIERVDSIRVTSLSESDLAVGAPVEIVIEGVARGTTEVLDLYYVPSPLDPYPTWQLLWSEPMAEGGFIVTSYETLPRVDGDRMYLRALLRSGATATPCPRGNYDDVDDLFFRVSPAPLTRPDVVPPTVAITVPQEGAALGVGARALEATASDDLRINRVEFFLDSFLVGSDATAPYSAPFNAIWFGDGPHVIRAEAYDDWGNKAVASIHVTSDGTRPSVILSTPLAGDVLSRTVTISALADDLAGIARVEFFLDGQQLLGTAAASPWRVSWDTTAVAKGAHSLSARATDGSGNTQDSPSVSIQVNNPPLAPGNLTAAMTSATTASLSWADNSGDETSFLIERRTGSGTYAQIASVGANVVTYEASGLSAGTTFTFRVRASNASGDSTYSNTASVTTPTPPAAPSSLVATATSMTSVSLSWTDNSGDETSFLLEMRIGSTGTYSQIASVGANVRSYSASGLSAGTTYRFRVRASNGVVESGYSNEVTVTTPAPPAAPTSLVATATSTTAVSLSWTDNSANETSFLVERKTGSTGTYAQIASVGANVRTYTVSGLSAGTTYYFRVRATNSYGTSGYSNELGVTTPAPPVAPTSLAASTTSTTAVFLSWTDNSANETSFLIERKTGSTGTYAQIASVGANVATYAASGLSANVTYYFRVRASNGSGASAYSNEASATTFGPVAAPTGLVATTITSTAVNLSWTDNSADETSFLIERSTYLAGAWSQIASVAANVRTYQASGLSPGISYCFRVRASNSSGRSAYSNLAIAATYGPPAAPSSLAATAIASGTVSLAWRDNSVNETSFLIERKTGSTGTWAQAGSVGANELMCFTSGLSPGVTYYFRLRASNSYGTSAPSNEASVTTPVPPAAPTNLVATATSSTSVNLSWVDNSANEDTFRIERKTGPTGMYLEIGWVGADVRTYAASGLSAGVTYSFRVRAVTSPSAYSAYTNEANVTTPAALLPASLTTTATFTPP